MLAANIPAGPARADGILVGKTDNYTLSVPATIALIDGEWRLYLYPFDVREPMGLIGAEEHLASRGATPYTAPGRDGWIVLQVGTPDDVLAGIREAGYPVHRTTEEEIREQGEAWAEIRGEYDERIIRGEVDW